MTGGATSTDTLNFNAISIIGGTLIPVGPDVGGGFHSPAGSVVLFGQLSDSLGLFNTTNALMAFSENGGEINFTDNEITLVGQTPEPNSLVLLGTGLMSAAGVLVRRRRICVA